MAKLLSKKTKRKIEAFIIPPFACMIMHFLYLTCRKRYHFDKSKVDKEPSVFVFWHGEIVMAPFAYFDYRNSKNIDLVVSRHHDGEIAARILEILGGGTLRGSSSRGGLLVLKNAFKSLRNGRDIGITPDGPRGPRHSVADGAVMIAQKRSVAIVAVNAIPSRAWRLKSWDRFAIPKPFCTLDFYYSDPFYVSDASTEEAKNKIKEELMRHAFKD